MHKPLKYVMFLVILSALFVPPFSVIMMSPVEADPGPGLLSQAFIAYRSSTGSGLNFPKNRTWDGSNWGSEVEMATAGSPVRQVRVAYNPRSDRYYEKIVVTLSLDGRLDAYIWTGSAWSVYNNIGSTPVNKTTTITGGRPFDVAYESRSGRALIVYDVNIADAQKDLGYRIWNGTGATPGLEPERYINFTLTEGINDDYGWIALASNPNVTIGSPNQPNQIALAANDVTAGASFAMIWDGTKWVKPTSLATTNTLPALESTGIEYSTYYNKIMAVAGNGVNAFVYKVYNQSTAAWTTAASFDPDASAGTEVSFVSLKRDPAATSTTDYIMLVEVDDNLDMYVGVYKFTATSTSKTEWTGTTDQDVDSGAARCFDFDWEPTGDKGLLVWGTTAGYIQYNKFTAPNTWADATWADTVTYRKAMGTGTHPWVELRRNPRTYTSDIKILGAVLEATQNDLGAIKWDGTTLTVIGAATFTADTTATTWESFELEFQQYIPANIYVDPASQSQGSYNVFSVDIRVTDADTLYGWEAQLFYNTTVLTALNVTQGAFLTSGGGSTFFNVTYAKLDQYNATHGRVWITATLLTDIAGVSGNGVLATVKFIPDYGAASSFLRLADTKLVSRDINYKVIRSQPHTRTLGSATVSFTYQPKIYFNPATPTKNWHTSFSVDINITDIRQLYAWDIQVTFNLKLMNATISPAPTEGPFLSGAGTTVFKWRVDNSTGIVRLNSTLTGNVNAPNATGGTWGKLATINFITFGLVSFPPDTKHMESVAFNSAYDVGEYIYRDDPAGTGIGIGTVSTGDVRITRIVLTYAAGTTVASTNVDAGGQSLIAFKTYEKHMENISSNGIYDVSEPIYNDTDTSGAVSVGDKRLTALAVTYAAGTTVASTNVDAGGQSLIAFKTYEKHNETVEHGSAYDVGESIYNDTDTSGAVSVGDKRLTAVQVGSTSYAAGSTVAAGNLDIGQSLDAFPANGKHRENVAVNTKYDVNEFVYNDTDTSGGANAGDVRLTAVPISYSVNSIVAAQNADVGCGLVAFAANEKHRENVAVNTKYDANEFVYRDVDTSGGVNAGDIRLRAVPLSYADNSGVAAQDADVGRGLVAFAANEKFRENLSPGGTYTRTAADWEYIYRDVDTSGGVTISDVRLTDVGAYAAGTTVTSGDTDLTETSPLDFSFSNMTIYSRSFNRKYTLYHQKIDGTVTVTTPAGVPEFPLGFALEISLLVAIAYLSWKKRRPKLKHTQTPSPITHQQYYRNYLKTKERY